MADELTSGYAPAPSEEQAPASTPPQRPDDGASAPDKPRINLQDLPEFRQYQAQLTRQLSIRDQELRTLRDQVREMKMAGLDDMEALKFQLQETQREKEQILAEINEAKAQQERDADLRKLSKTTGAPLDVLAQANTIWEAVDLADQWKEQQNQAQQQRRAANTPDLGGGSAASGPARDLNQARRDGNAVAYVRYLLGD